VSNTEQQAGAKRNLARAFFDTVKSLRQARVHFGQGTSNATEEAGFLLSYTVRLAPEDLDSYRDRILSHVEERRLKAILEFRIKARLPSAYITREAWLRGRKFHVNKQVIIPRSHIAFLLGDELRTWLRRRPRAILDLCTGSGCLAVLAALEYPRAKVDALDISRNATKLAEKNIGVHGVSDRVRVMQSDLYAAVERESYDLIICNPPYVSAGSMAKLPPEHRHEPRNALFGGDKDGLGIVRRILHSTGRHLRREGVLVCEVGNSRRLLERLYPRVPFLWLDTGIPGADVFLISKDSLPQTD